MNAHLADAVQRSHATQQLINQVLHQGTRLVMDCEPCRCERVHLSLRLDGICYTVCRTCHSMTTTTER